MPIHDCSSICVRLKTQGTAKESLLREKARLLAEADAVSKEISGGQLHEYVYLLSSRLNCYYNNYYYGLTYTH